MLTFSIIVWLLCLFLLACLVERLWKHAGGQAFYWIWIPGVMIHELFHALGCLLTGAKIQEVVIFEKNGGHVSHEPPKIPIVGQVLISLAPFVGHLAAIHLCWKYLRFPASQGWLFSMRLPGLPDTFARLGRGFWQIAHDAWGALGAASYLEWRTYLFLYCAVSLGITMAPSKADIKNCAQGVMVLACALFLLDVMPFAHEWIVKLESVVYSVVRSSAMILLVCLFLAGGAWVIRKIIRRPAKTRNA